MINRSKHDLLAHTMAEFSEELGVELFPIIYSQLFWDSESANDVLPEELSDCLGGYVD